MGRLPLLHDADLRLARAVVAGDRAAFQALFDFAFPRLYRFVRTRAHDVDRAEEVVQATLCTALAQLGQYRGEAALLTWMTTICRRTLAASRLAEERVSATGAWLESLPGESEDAEARLSRQEMASRVHRVLDWLPAAYAEILAWKYFEEASVEEIARRLGVGLKAAESRLTRAREAFRREFSALVRSSVRDPEGRTCP